MMKDPEMSLRRDVCPKLEELSPNWQSHTVYFLLKEYWKKQGYELDFGNQNFRCYEPQVTVVNKYISFDLCDKNHPKDYLIQLAIALIKSCRGEYNSLPGLYASDDEFSNHRSKKISIGQAEMANTLLQKLAEYQFDSDTFR